MGVHGLWKLLEPSGKPVPLESLENKVLAVDVSIWLHQLVKGFQDSRGNTLPNAHLLGLFHRICKLLFYKIRPVFVFDGGVPHLKKQTLAARKQQKTKAELEFNRARDKLLKNIIKHTAVRNMLGDQPEKLDVSPAKCLKKDDMFALPPPLQRVEGEQSGSEIDDDLNSSEEEAGPYKSVADLHSVDVHSEEFRALPADVRHDILTELRETRKQNSWGQLHEMPKESPDFSNYQMKRLLKRRSVQVSLEEARREMGGRTLSLGELQEILTEQGIVTDVDVGKRIASDNLTRYVYLTANSDTKATSQAGAGNKTDGGKMKAADDPYKPSTSQPLVTGTKQEKYSLSDEKVNEDIFDDIVGVDLESNCSYDEEEENLVLGQHQLARNYMYENSGLTQEQILSIIKTQSKSPVKMKQTTEKQKQDLDAGTETFILNEESLTRENSGLTQEQILSIIKAKNDSQANTMQSTEEQKQDLNLENKIPVLSEELHNCIKEHSVSDVIQQLVHNTDHKLKTELTEINESNFKRVVPQSKSVVCGTHIADKSSVLDTEGLRNNLKPLNNVPERNTIVQEASVEGFIEKPGIDIDTGLSEGIPTGQVTESSSDSDEEFLEVTDQVPTLILNSDLSHPKDKQFEVVIQPGEHPKEEDDIFAEVFATCNNNKEEEVEILSSGENATGKQCSTVGHSHTSNQNVTSVTDIEVSEPVREGQQAVSTLKENLVGQTMDTSDQPAGEELNSVVGEAIKKTKQKASPIAVTTEELQKIQATLEEQQEELILEKNKQERLAANITEQMYIEAQELLQLFGIPYIVAPMEAEAQCAFLDAVSLTDGTITDDSDIWLFGGRKVYKNFFNQKKYVMEFQSVDIKHCFRLTRQQLILLALLVGSDYTTGLQGIGPVTALEILAAFPSNQPDSENAELPSQEVVTGLQKFHQWWKTGRSTGPGRAVLRNKLKDVEFYEGFPNVAAVEAYLRPKVDDSRERFSWSSPDLASLRDFANRKFGWAQTKSDKILLPVLKKQSERKNQLQIDSFFQYKPKLVASKEKLSKRVQKAVHRLGKEAESDSDEPLPKKVIVEKNARVKSRRGRGRGRGSTQRPEEEKPGGGEKTVSDRESGITEREAGQASQNESKNKTNTKKVKSDAKPSMSEEFIPQKVKDKINLMKNKLKAIEVFRRSKRGLDKTEPEKRVKRKILQQANLSESSSDEDK